MTKPKKKGGKKREKIWIGIAHPGEELRIKLVDADDASFVKHFCGEEIPNRKGRGKRGGG